jgi:ParB family chromosome partitioning protein
VTTQNADTEKVSLKERQAAALAEAVFAPVGQHRNPLKDLTQVSQRLVPLRFIQPNPDQPRNRVDETSPEFEELRESIRQHGLLQPVSLWQLDSDEEAYTIIAGERRWRAFVQLAEQDPADFGRIPATVMHVVGDDREAQVLMKAIIENVVREDLKESEKAAAMRQLREWTGWTFEAIADRMGLSVHRVLGLAAIARHDAVMEAVDDGLLTKKQAIAIGQAGVDSEIASAMARHATDLDPKVVRQVAKQAAEADASVPAEARVQAARAAVLVGKRAVQRSETYPLRSPDGGVQDITREVVVLGNTALRALRPRVTEMERDAFAAMIEQACQETSVWPMPAVARLAPEVCRAMIDEMCRAADYYPTQPSPAP